MHVEWFGDTAVQTTQEGEKLLMPVAGIADNSPRMSMTRCTRGWHSGLTITFHADIFFLAKPIMLYPMPNGSAVHLQAALERQLFRIAPARLGASTGPQFFRGPEPIIVR